MSVAPFIRMSAENEAVMLRGHPMVFLVAGENTKQTSMFDWVIPTGFAMESVGAFPSVVLAAGDYTARAKHDGKTCQLNFTVTSGANRDVEVLTE